MSADPSLRPMQARARQITALVILAALCPRPGMANNGFVAPGNGAVQLGLAGAGTAMAEDASATVRNPAAAVWIGSGATADLGIAIGDGGYDAGPVSKDSRLGLFELEPGRVGSVQGVFPVPSFAQNFRLNDRLAIGWGFTGAGLQSSLRGRTARFARGLPAFAADCDGAFGGGAPLSAATDLARICGRTEADVGVQLIQLIASAHVAWRVAPGLSIGAAPVLDVQRVSVRGFAAIKPFSNFPDRVTNNGNDYAVGGGGRVGLLWQISDGIGIAAAYQSRLYETPFNRYRGLISGGSLDVAPVIDLGLQLHLIQGHRFLFDVEQVRYGDLPLFRNSLDAQRVVNQCLVPRLLLRGIGDPAPNDACLGGSSGPGPGWHNITVYKFGYEGREGRLSWRAGYSFGGNPVGRDQTLVTALAPAISDQHAAVGLSWQLSPQLRFNWALIYAIKNSVTTSNGLSNVTPIVLADSTLVGFDASPDPQDQVVKNHFGLWQSQFELSWSEPP